MLFRCRKKKGKSLRWCRGCLPNDMIALVWFVSWFCETEVFGCMMFLQPSFGFSMFPYSFFRTFKLDQRESLLVHCGLFTSTVWLFSCHGISFCVYIQYILLRFGFVVASSNPLVKCGWEKWVSYARWTSSCCREASRLHRQKAAVVLGRSQCQCEAGKKSIELDNIFHLFFTKTSNLAIEYPLAGPNTTHYYISL